MHIEKLGPFPMSSRGEPLKFKGPCQRAAWTASLHGCLSDFHGFRSGNLCAKAPASITTNLKTCMRTCPRPSAGKDYNGFNRVLAR